VTHGEFSPGERLYIPSTAPKRARSEQPRLDPDTLHAVYTAYLGLLPLRREHNDFYASRGHADRQVARDLGYGSLPLGYEAARRTVGTLVAQFGIEIMQRVPGFYPGRDGRLLTHTARAAEDAAVIPFRDEHGRIIALLRHSITGSKPKYMIFAGSTNNVYTVAGSWPVGSRRQLAIIEGPHKAHVVASYSTGIRVLGIPGAHLNDAHLAAIERFQPDIVIEALDADKLTNPAIRTQGEHMHAALLASEMATSKRVEIVTAIWEPEEGKGLDDLLAAGRRPRLRTVPRRAAVGARKPMAIPEPGPIRPGRTLAEVQAETEKIIGEWVRHRRQKHGRVKIIQVPPGVGKSTALVQAVVKHGAAARILVSTRGKAIELSDSSYSERSAFMLPTIHTVEGRNAENCLNIDVVNAARAKGHDVAVLVCTQCRHIDDCREGGYYSQFEVSGPLVAPVEMLYSGAFLRDGDLVVVDDASLERAMIDTRKITSADALQIASTVPAGPTRELMTIAQRAIDALRASDTATPDLDRAE
jgi:hypothetical protein